jgi:hypothetical protein
MMRLRNTVGKCIQYMQLTQCGLRCTDSILRQLPTNGTDFQKSDDNSSKAEFQRLDSRDTKEIFGLRDTRIFHNNRFVREFVIENAES